jgi:peptide/nickel transport system substrate-binding protein
VWVPVSPTNPNLEPTRITPQVTALVEGLFHALVLPVREPIGDLLTSGHTWTVDGHEVSVPCLIDDFAVESDGRVRLHFDDRFTYWNGESLDARAYWLRDRFRTLAASDEDADFDGELVSETEYLRPTYERVPNRFETEGVHPGLPPLPPSVFEPAVERLESTGTRSTETGTDGPLSERFGLEQFAERGYGTGPYVVRSPQHIVREGRDAGLLPNVVETADAYRREAYPGSPAPGGIAVLGPASWVTKEGKFVGSGILDAGSGVIADDGDYTREFVDDSIQQVATYRTPARTSSTLVFNWANPHLKRLWVRRALVAAIPFESVVEDVFGSSADTPARFVGLPELTDEQVFDTAFLDSLVTYPLAAYEELAATWLREAGYERAGGRWLGPDGDRVSLELITHGARDRRLASGLKRSLEAFGITVTTSGLRDFAYEDRLLDLDFDLAISNRAGGWGVGGFYGDWFDAGDGWLSTSVLTAVGDAPSSCRDDPVAATPETVTLPPEPALDVPGVEYPGGGETYHWPESDGENVSVCEASATLRRADIDRQRFGAAARVCARWYNYALPTVLFAQDRAGLWVDTDELVAPSPDHPSTRVTAQAPEPRDTPATPLPPHYYHLHAGTLRPR